MTVWGKDSKLPKFFYSQQLLDNVSSPQLLRALGLLLLGHSKRDQLTLPLHWGLERKLLKHGDSLKKRPCPPGQGTTLAGFFRR